MISIHAPPRGATALCANRRFSTYRFQFTPLREGRRAGLHRACKLPFHFNSRPSARGDDRLNEEFGFVLISIHAPPRGATFRNRRSKLLPAHFNSRPSARGDRAEQSFHDRLENFNSRPSARGDGKRYAISANLLFNPYKSAWLNNSATQFVEIILVIFHRIIA